MSARKGKKVAGEKCTLEGGPLDGARLQLRDSPNTLPFTYAGATGFYSSLPTDNGAPGTGPYWVSL